jgi:large subunit ribosomal protein L24
MSLSVKKGDTVLIIAGRDRGKRGVIERVLPAENRVVVTGINIRKRHLKPSQKHPRGGIIEIFAPLHRANVMPIDPATEQPTRADKIGQTTK